MSAQFAVQDAALITGRWLTQLHDPWPIEAARYIAEHGTLVRVVLAGKRGSAPRDAGTCMLVMPRDLAGTIGGGHLEWQAIHMARDMLADSQSHKVQVRKMLLGQDLAQCCGGEVQLWLERFTRDDLSWLRRLSLLIKDHDAPLLLTQHTVNDTRRTVLRPGMPNYPTSNFSSGIRLTNSDGDNTLIERLHQRRINLWLYGAGHVGQALVRLLNDLPIDITWIDARAELLPVNLPDNVRIKIGQSPLELARSAPASAHHRIMTHDHGLDYALCRELLDSDFASLGVIGSNSKAVRFRAQLKRDGVMPERVAALLCPIGMQIDSKEPAAIAIGVAAQLLQQAALPGTASLATETFKDAVCSNTDCSSCQARRTTP
jgi:xanthine dehydrogenase accessory factor